MYGILSGVKLDDLESRTSLVCTIFQYSIVFSLLQLAVLVTSGWLVGQHQTEVVWRCV